MQDPLPTDKCLEALAELRHSKWFAVTAANMPSCVECIRIVKDLSNRDPDWTVLSDWAIELLVERALFTAWMPLNPAASLMRVMEVLSIYYFHHFVFIMFLLQMHILTLFVIFLGCVIRTINASWSWNQRSM